MYYPCAVRVSQLSFLVANEFDLLEYLVDTADPKSSSGWQPTDKWPKLKEERNWNPGCAIFNNKVVIVGGYTYVSHNYLNSAEVVDLETMTISYAAGMKTPRAHFFITTIIQDMEARIFG